MNTEFRMVILEDSATDAELLTNELRHTHFQFSIRYTATRESFLKVLEEFDPQIILSDYNLPSFDGLSALAMAQKVCPKAPFIFVSGAIGEERAIETLKNGATDYVLKDNFSRLVPAVERAVLEIIERATREKIQEELSISEARFRSFMDNSPAVAFLKTSEGRYVYVNKPFEERFHLSKMELIDKTDAEIWPASIAAQFEKNDQTALIVNRTIEFLETLPASDGFMRSWRIFKFPVMYSTGRKLIGGMAVDVTEQKQLEQKLKQAIGELARLNAEMDHKNEELKKLDRLKSDFISNVSHELRTPMTIMRESTSQILDGLCGPVTEGQQKRLNSILDNMDRLKHIVDNLLDISKLELRKVRLTKSKVDIVQLVKDIGFSFEPKVKSKGLDLRYRFSEDCIEIEADKEKLIQVFMNLVSNAVKFTNYGYIEIAVENYEHKVECHISDSGVGINEKDLTKVFDKFEQFGRQEGPGEKGTGLGLAISQEIIHLHNGQIWVKSFEQGGSTFSFILPRLTQAPIENAGLLQRGRL